MIAGGAKNYSYATAAILIFLRGWCGVDVRVGEMAAHTRWRIGCGGRESCQRRSQTDISLHAARAIRPALCREIYSLQLNSTNSPDVPHSPKTRRGSATAPEGLGVLLR